MQIFLLRHGEAQPNLSPDNARPLTERGRVETLGVISQKATELANASAIWASPYLRAQQTAELLVDYVPSCTPETNKLLVPDANPRALADALQNSGLDSVILVSHQPLVGVFLDWLVGLEPGCQRMGTSALASITTDVLATDCGELQWLIQP